MEIRYTCLQDNNPQLGLCSQFLIIYGLVWEALSNHAGAKPLVIHRWLLQHVTYIMLDLLLHRWLLLHVTYVMLDLLLHHWKHTIFLRRWPVQTDKMQKWVHLTIWRYAYWCEGTWSTGTWPNWMSGSFLISCITTVFNQQAKSLRWFVGIVMLYQKIGSSYIVAIVSPFWLSSFVL